MREMMIVKYTHTQTLFQPAQRTRNDLWYRIIHCETFNYTFKLYAKETRHSTRMASKFNIRTEDEFQECLLFLAASSSSSSSTKVMHRYRGIEKPAISPQKRIFLVCAELNVVYYHHLHFRSSLLDTQVNSSRDEEENVK